MVAVVEKNIHFAEATVRNVRGSVYKMNLVAGAIRNRTIDEVLLYLSYCDKRVSGIFLNCLKSAVANAEHNFGMNSGKLKLSSVLVGKDMVLKRFMARGRGRSSRICKIYSRITLVVSEINNS